MCQTGEIAASAGTSVHSAVFLVPGRRREIMVDQSSGVKPSDETLKNKTYPIILPFRFYWDEKAVSDQAKKFVDFCASKGHPSQE